MHAPVEPSWTKVPLLDDVGRQLMLAADIMEQRGHCPDALEDDQGRVCIQQAMQLAHPKARSIEAVNRFQASTGWEYQYHTGFNRNHTMEECVAAMRKAAWYRD